MNKKYLCLIFMTVWSSLFICSCSDDETVPTDIIAPSSEGTFTDERDGSTYRWVRYGNLDWMTDNFHYYLNDNGKCRQYGMDKSSTAVDVERYGRIYSYTGAKEACPDGWRLPTDEDWKNLEICMGMSEADANQKDWRGNVAKRMISMYETTTPINILLCGYYTPNMIMQMTGYRFWGSKGYYWTATTDIDKGDDFYFFREFMYNNDGVRRQSTTGDFFMSVKYVRNAR